ncbi:hypothetical protein ACFO1B_22445 [Dactylosporangium siamense]|uniref:Lipoprotein n=1 Tax=Dactylosporangium siamense TaxID=685454 RepID=A0A919UCA7_9ACTN|nr:hypothetical protein [Dactylosporangium siamense]GIG50157.1 hypothetical protein Dsi01nite_081980 [Dactylosporangium siamense]
MRGVLGAAAVLVCGLLAGCTGDEVPAPAAAASTKATVAEDLAVVAGGGIAVPAAKQLPANAAIGGPDYAVRLTEVGAADHLEPAVVTQFGKMQSATGVSRDATGTIAAGAGKEFLFVRLAAVPGVKSDPSPDVTARLRIGEQARAVAGMITPDSVIVALVPAGAAVTLVVADRDKDQSVDVRTGAVGAGAVAAYLKARPYGEVTYQLVGQIGGEPKRTYVDITVSAALEPFDHRAKGTWAPAGHTWLRMWVELKVSGIGVLEGTIDLKQSLQVTANGKAIAVEAASAEIERGQAITDYTIHDEVRMDVAEGSVQTLTFRFEPKGTLTRDGKPTTLKLDSSPQQKLTLK